jgi:hypothetical protein
MILIAASATSSWETVHSRVHAHPNRVALVQVLFLLVATIFAIAWWTIWKKKPSWRWWATAASLLNVFAWTSMLPFGWHVVARWFVAFFWLTTLLGLMGLFVTLISYKPPVANRSSHP